MFPSRVPVRMSPTDDLQPFFVEKNEKSTILAGSQAAMPPPMPRPPGARGNDPRSRGGSSSQGGGGGGGVGKRFWHTSGGSVSSLGKGETVAMQRRMAAKRQRDKATRTKRVR